MSTVEAAASLFGSDGDSGPDPFAVIGNEVADTTHPLGQDEQQNQTSSSHSLPMGQDASSLFADQMYPDSHGEQYDRWSIPTTLDATTGHSQHSNDTAPPCEHQHGHYSEASFSTGYEQHSAYAPQPVTRTPHGNTSSIYEPYDPAPYHSYGNNQDSSQQYALEQTAHDPYKAVTSTPTTPNAYPSQQSAMQQPAIPSQQQAAYDKYKPLSRSVSSPYSSPFVTTLQQPPPSISPAQTSQATPTPTAAAFRPKTFNAYDPPLPPPKVSRRAVSARNPRSASPGGGHQLDSVYGQTLLSPPPVPTVPALLPAPVTGTSVYSSPPATSALRPPSRPSPPRREPTQHYNPNQYNTLSGSDQLGDSYPPPSSQEMHGLPPARRDPSISHPSRYAPPPLHDDRFVPMIQSSHTQDLPEGTPTPRRVSNNVFKATVPESDSAPPQSHDWSVQQPDTQAIYTSDDMPWGDPEGGMEESIDSSHNNAKEPHVPYDGGDAYSLDQRHYSQTPPPNATSPEAVPPHVPVEINGSAFTIASPSTSPPRAKTHHRQSTIVPNDRASPKPPSSHSRSGSSASSASSLRSPVNRVSSPLRNAIDPNGQDAVHPSNVPPKALHPYEPSHYAPHRTASPSSLRSVHSQQGVAPHHSYAQPTSNATPANLYDPKPVSGPQRAMSPSSFRSASPAPDPYAPPMTMPAYVASHFRGRATSNGSTLSSSGAPDVSQLRHDYGLGLKSHVGEPSSYDGVSAYSIGQDVHMPPATRPPYAPSPSLLGSNDPLGRTSSRAPIISFGFGGKILTWFHGSADLNTGFDVALSSRRTTHVTVRVLHNLLPEYALEAEYPGPLFSDSSSPVANLVRTGTSQLKTKKGRVIKYLEERAEEISRGTMYISDKIEKQHLEGKLVLVQLLKVMVENDGVLSGSPQIDTAVRAALLPRIAGTMREADQDGSAVLSTPVFASPLPHVYGMQSALPAGNETPISVSTLFPSSLDKIQEFLVRGERRQAYHYALDEKLWAHAMIIAGGIDREAWKEVVNEFLKAELGVHEAPQRATLPVRAKDVLSTQTNGREWLRVAYSVFSGHGPAAVQELVPTNLLSRATAGLQVPTSTLSHITPMSPNFPSAAATAQIPVGSLSKWPEIAATIVSSPLSPECSATLTALGDYLVSHNLVEGAHACYLLSPQTSIMGGVGSPGARMVLLGSQSPHTKPTFFRDADPIIFTEIAEFAFSLKTPPKGQEPFHGFPHLQAYKLIRAAYLADIGHVQAATRYCEAINATMGRPSPHFTPALVEGLKDLADRLIGSPHVDKSASWIGGKVNKPSLDSIGSWIEGRLTKFIAGEGDEPTDPSKAAQFAGPFSTHGSISSTTTSACPSPPPTMVNSHSMSATQPPRRSGSAMALASSAQTHVPIDRASSAMDYYRPTRQASPAPPKTAPLHSTGYPYSSYAAQRSGHGVANAYVPAYGSEPSSRKTSLEMTAEEGSEPQSAAQEEPYHQQQEGVENNQQPQESGSWWNSLADSAPTPTPATFHHVSGLGDGLISLMDDPALSVASNPSVSSSRQRVERGSEDEEDDLGLGNSTHKRKQEEGAKLNTEDNTAAAPAQETAKPEEKQDTQSPATPLASSWLSRLWKRSDTPGPVKASLGEETSFYFDKELKRWVNKKAGAEAAQPQAPLPPPSRAQTASPSVGGFHPNGSTNGAAFAPPQAPPPRTSSAIDLSTSPTAKVPMRVRSNLVPAEVASVPNTPAPGMASMPPPPPMGRPRSQAAKKNVRSRYVDVFQHEGATGAA
ncbi:hypothetical protein BDN67DRAFT_1007736 [Paxillus ammoniavirescens]|nr:hypothetical protein BDN67DRAFT_1007736 [Paxillus ammoniavirescens]